MATINICKIITLFQKSEHIATSYEIYDGETNELIDYSYRNDVQLTKWSSPLSRSDGSHYTDLTNLKSRFKLHYRDGTDSEWYELPGYDQTKYLNDSTANGIATLETVIDNIDNPILLAEWDISGGKGLIGNDGNASQNFVFDQKNGTIYSIYETGASSVNSSVLHSFELRSGLQTTVKDHWYQDARIGHQGMGLEYKDNDVYIWTSRRHTTVGNEAYDGRSVIRFKLIPGRKNGATKPTTLGMMFDVETYELFTDFTGSATNSSNLCISYDKKYLVAKHNVSGGHKFRVWLLKDLIDGGPGNYSTRYLYEFTVSSAYLKYPFQSMACKGKYIYCVGGAFKKDDDDYLVVLDFTGKIVYHNPAVRAGVGLIDDISKSYENEGVDFITIDNKTYVVICYATGSSGLRRMSLIAIGGYLREVEKPIIYKCENDIEEINNG